MGINVREYSSDHDFFVNGSSYIGTPKSNTAMYVGKKIETSIENLKGVEQCLVFVDEQVHIGDEVKKNHVIIPCKNPQLEYAKFSERLEKERRIEERRIGITLVDGGYYKSNDVAIGEGAYIEPGCFIGYGTRIGKDAVILSGTSIRYTDIGDNFLANENVVIGTNAYTMTIDEKGYKTRIYSLGKTIIGDNVEIGSLSNVSRGSVGETIIDDNVKIDSLVHIGHDVRLKKNVEIAAGVIIGGFTIIEENTFVGLNATLKNRIVVDDNCVIGMGAAVMQSVPDKMTMLGNPAKGFSKGDL